MKPRDIVDRIAESVGLDGKPRPIKTAIEDELIRAGMPAISAAEGAEQKLSAVKKIIDTEDRERTRLGETYGLRLLGTSRDSVSGSCFVLPDDDSAIAAAKENRIHVDRIESEIKNLNFSDFEKFGARVLQQMGAKNTKVTPHAGDQGIDFYGEISLADIEGLPVGFFHLSHGAKLTVVGQAKHYPENKIGPSHIRELVGAMSLARTDTYSKDSIDLFDGLHLPPFAPVLAVFFSTGKFTRGAYTLARNAGLIAFSGHQLATFLADHGVGLISTGGTTSFSTSEFKMWLQS